jgi:hypothetical protein
MNITCFWKFSIDSKFSSFTKKTIFIDFNFTASFVSSYFVVARRKLFKIYDSRCPSGKLPLCSTFSYLYQRYIWALFEGTSSTLPRRHDPHLLWVQLSWTSTSYERGSAKQLGKTKYVIFNPKNKNIPQT